MTNRIDACIERAQTEKRLAFLGLVPIDPASFERSRDIARMMVASGIDVLMPHVPNWLPWMEGAVLQKAAQAPRFAGITRMQIFNFIKSLREEFPDVPLIVMSLYDTAMTMGQKDFIKLCEEADIDGFDLPNYPLESTSDRFGFYRYCLESNRHLILAISYEIAMANPDMPEYELLQQLARDARGFAFVMNAPGGQSGSSVKLSQRQLTEAVRRFKTAMVGQDNSSCTVSIVCGISDAADIEKVRTAGAESFMIGSAYVKALQEGAPLEDVAAYLRSIRQTCICPCKE